MSIITPASENVHIASRPMLSRNLFYMIRDEKHLFLEPESPDWIVVNSNAAYILGLCDGTRTVREIEDHIKELGGDPIAARALISHAVEHSLFHEIDKIGIKEGQALNDTIKQLYPLRNIYIQMTNACNLSCTYCYASSGKSDTTLTDNELITLFDNARYISPTVSVVLTGGEPLLNSFTLDFAEEIKSRGNDVYLTTNGTLVNHKNAEQISRIFSRVRVSIDGIDESVHAETRGHGNHARVSEAIDILVKAKANVEVAMVVTKKNKSQLPRMVERYGRKLRFQPLLQSGRQRMQESIGLSPEDYYESIKPFSGELIGAHVDFMRQRHNNRCSAAESSLSISENGDAYPCQIFHFPEFKGGNIRRNSLHDIIQSESFERVRKLSVENLKVCNTCAIRKICGGSCRAYAYAETGRDDCPDSSCEFQKLSIMDALFESRVLHGC